MSAMTRLGYAALVPIGLVLRLLADPLRLRRPRATNWQPAREGRAARDE